MAALPNTFQSTVAVGNREELSDIVNRITPEDTPIYTMIEKGKAESTNPQWEIDELAPPAANAQVEGDEYTFSATTPPVRVGNHTQIFRKTGIVSGTREAVANAGNVEKTAEQKLKKAIEVRKDVELSIVSNSASVAGNTRVSGGLPSWIETNVSRGAGGANGGYDPATKLTVAETIGTQRAFSKALLDTVSDMVFTSGGNAKHPVGTGYVKTVFATFMADPNVAALRSAVPALGKKTVLSGSVDIYRGPNLMLEITANRVMSASAATARRAFIIDPDMLEWLWLRKIAEDKDVAKTGDAKKFVMLGEGTLKVKNEAAHGEVADIFGLSAAA
ncbi:DUF5309 domain-containing protein [Devosia sp. A8/3-2]|nr:DUF5309 domain-containing protein [Devosia sp. A8/3-2]